jgi:monoamine oxidase
VAILGAGVAGLCAAYELDRAGYDCTVLEASNRIGGRSLTLRRGDSFKEMHTPVQECRFDEGEWFNAGPSRIPHHHVHVIDYCRRFGVTLQPYIFAGRANLVHSAYLGNGRTMQARRVLHDLHGHIAELLDKCITTTELDLPVPRRELESFRDMLAKFGDLTRIERNGKTTYSYRNRYGRAGYETPPGLATEPGRPLGPLALDEILRSRVWDDYIFREEEFFWQTSLLEPAGGMDNFVKAFARQPSAGGTGALETLVQLGAKVTGVQIRSDGVTISYADDSGGKRTLSADYCICTIPVPILATLATNLPGLFISAAKALPFQAAAKVAWQADRFWETNDDIYGGISWTTDTISQIQYPSHGFLSRKGILTGAYLYGETATSFNKLPVAERLRLAREQGERLHPDFSKSVEHGLAIGWDNMEFERFAWADESDDGFHAGAKVLAQPQGRFCMAGDQVTFWSGWQEGAVISAWEAVKAIDQARAR